MPRSHNRLKLLLPFGVLLLGIAGAIAMIRARPAVETRPLEVLPPLVRVLTVHPRDLQLSVRAQGTVMPRTESTLTPEVNGRVVGVSPELVAGGFFEPGDVLLTIDAADYEAAVARARAQVTQAQLRVAREEEEAAIARQDWQVLGGGEATPLVLHQPQIADARAAAAAARASLAQAERDLERTRLRAPFAGRVRQKSVDVGQFVTRGVPLATVYAIDAAEVRLPLPDEELAYLDIPLGYRGEPPPAAGASDNGRAAGRAAAPSAAPAAGRAAAPVVLLRAEFAGQECVWTGRVVRTEGELDPRSRMVHVVARVDDPYGRHDGAGRPPLAVGLFVDAEILGRQVHDVVVVPRLAMRGRDQVLVCDADNRLRFRRVGVLKADREQVVLASGLADGERLCLSSLDAPTDGMLVRAIEENASPEISAASREMAPARAQPSPGAAETSP